MCVCVLVCVCVCVRACVRACVCVRERERERDLYGSTVRLYEMDPANLGNYKRALQYHQQEISLSEAAGDQIGTAVAHRKVGECFCELSSYQDAIHHQKQHLRMSRCLGK